MSNQVSAQVDSVRYQARFNPETCLHDFYIVIEGGSATIIPHRAQFNSQFTVVYPTSASINGGPINNMPLQNNQNYTSTTPMVWKLSSSAIDPASAPGLVFQSIVPTLSPASFYNNLVTGDTIKLFSLDISPVTECGVDVRVYENGVDPDSNADGMNGSDYSNGFTIGGSVQKYVGNHAPVTPPLPELSAVVNCDNGIGIYLTAEVSGCQTPPTYSWSG
ncbi:MAG: hypothetical protein V3V14_14875, partial [Saprospiraceae bacterium]